jgi:hypothetical protein
VQLNLGYSQGRGYFSEPYKIYDNRPRERDHTTVLARWNHYFSDLGGSARLSYRYYTDTFGIRSHTLGLEYVQALPYGFVVTPTLRGYSQHAADFFVEVDPNAEPFATNPPQGAQFYSEDQRLASFGALTVGIKVAKEFGTHWLADVRYERYEQRNDWYVGGSGSQYLANLSSRWFQVGISYTF